MRACPYRTCHNADISVSAGAAAILSPAAAIETKNVIGVAVVAAEDGAKQSPR
jgi:hypothetical protein